MCAVVNKRAYYSNIVAKSLPPANAPCAISRFASYTSGLKPIMCCVLAAPEINSGQTLMRKQAWAISGMTRISTGISTRAHSMTLMGTMIIPYSIRIKVISRTAQMTLGLAAEGSSPLS